MNDRIMEQIQDYIYQFKDYLISERSLSENTVYSYYNDILQFFDYLKSNSEFKNISDIQDIGLLDDFIVYLSNIDIKSRSIARKISSLSLFLKFLKIEGVINENPSYLVNRPKTGSKLPVYLTLDEIEKFIDSFDKTKPEGIRDSCLFELIYSCGLRVSEVSNLDFSSVYFKDKIIQVIGKGSKERYVPAGELAMVKLDDYLKKSRPVLYRKNKHTDALFLNFRGERLSRKGIWKNLKTAGKLSGIRKNFSVHSLRHSFATHLIQNGADIRSVQTLLGHKSIITTEIYTHLDMSYIRDVYNKFHSHK
jgi:integrase/recombinase XerD